MIRRIGLWSLCGLFVAFLWFLYFTWLTYGAYHGGPGFTFSPAMEALVNITAPIRPLFGHVRITWYWSIVLNASVYACIGLAVETVRLALRFTFVRLRH